MAQKDRSVGGILKAEQDKITQYCKIDGGRCSLASLFLCTAGIFVDIELLSILLQLLNTPDDMETWGDDSHTLSSKIFYLISHAVL